MNESLTLIIGIIVLVLAWPIGNFLALKTKEELKSRQGTFRGVILVCLIGLVVSLVLWKDILLFSLAFIAIVTSRCLRKV